MGLDQQLVPLIISSPSNRMQQVAMLRICSTVQALHKAHCRLHYSLHNEQVTSDMSQIVRRHRKCVKHQRRCWARVQDTHYGCHTASTEGELPPAHSRKTRWRWWKAFANIKSTEKCWVLQIPMCVCFNKLDWMNNIRALHRGARVNSTDWQE